MHGALTLIPDQHDFAQPQPRLQFGVAESRRRRHFDLTEFGAARPPLDPQKGVSEKIRVTADSYFSFNPTVDRADEVSLLSSHRHTPSAQQPVNITTVHEAACELFLFRRDQFRPPPTGRQGLAVTVLCMLPASCLLCVSIVWHLP